MCLELTSKRGWNAFDRHAVNAADYAKVVESFFHVVAEVALGAAVVPAFRNMNDKSWIGKIDDEILEVVAFGEDRGEVRDKVHVPTP